MSQRMKTTMIALLALVLVFALVLPAFAHAQLLSSTPGDKASVETADEVTFTFNENINPEFVTVLVEGPDGDVVDGEPTVDGPVVTQAIAPTASGEYIAGYRVVSADGHPVSGEITFTLTDVPEPEPTDEPTETATTEPTSPEPTATEEPTADPTEAATEPDAVNVGGFGWPLGVMATLGIVVLALVAGGIAYLASRRGRD